jgi:hypothetical protein
MANMQGEHRAPPPLTPATFHILLSVEQEIAHG